MSQLPQATQQPIIALLSHHSIDQHQFRRDMLCECKTLLWAGRFGNSIPVRLDHPQAHVSLSRSQHASVTQTLARLEEQVPADQPLMVTPYGAIYYFLSGRPVPHRYTLALAPNIGFDGGLDAVARMRAADVRFVAYLRRDFPGSPSLEEFGPRLYEHLERDFEVIGRVQEPLGEHLRILERRETP